MKKQRLLQSRSASLRKPCSAVPPSPTRCSRLSQLSPHHLTMHSRRPPCTLSIFVSSAGHRVSGYKCLLNTLQWGR